MQIVAALSSFRIEFDFSFFTDFSDVTGDPVKTQAFSLDCFLKDIAPDAFPLLYFRIFWQIITAFFQIAFMFVSFTIAKALGIINYSITSIIYNIFVYTFVYLHPSVINKKLFFKIFYLYFYFYFNK